MEDLIAWFRACLDDDEKTAKAAADASGHDTWLSIGIEAGPDDDEKWIAVADRSWGVVAPHPDPPDDDTFYELGGDLFRQRGRRGLTDHIARHDPAAVLADVEAKRAVLLLCSASLVGTSATSPSSFIRGQDDGYREAMTEAVRYLARAYRHRPGWRTEWE